MATWLVTLIERRARGPWHLGGPWPNCTRLQWAELLVAAFRQAGVREQAGFALEPVPTAELKQRALRPLQAGMVSRHSEAATFQHTPLPVVVERITRHPPSG